MQDKNGGNWMMKKMKKSVAKQNNAFFMKYIENKIACGDMIFTGKGSKGEVVSKYVSEEEMRSFKPLYTSDKADKYYSVKKDMRENYYISALGTMVYLEKDNILLKKPDIVTGREYYKLRVTVKDVSYQISFQPSALVNLAFGGKSTHNATVLMENYGMIVFRQLTKKEIDKLLNPRCYPKVSEEARELVRLCLDSPKNRYHLVELNHEIDYVAGKNAIEIQDNRAINCDLSYSQFEYFGEHYALTYAPKEDSNDKEVERYMRGLNYYIPSTENFAVIPQGEHGGTIINDLRKTEDGLLQIGDKKYKIEGILDRLFCHKIILFDENGNVLKKGVDISPTYYEDFCKRYSTFIDEYGVPIKAYIGEYKGIDVYACTDIGQIAV